MEGVTVHLRFLVYKREGMILLVSLVLLSNLG